MRFEKLDFFEQVSRLQQLHKRLNNYLFSGQLHSIAIDIENLSAEESVKLGNYRRAHDVFPSKISFSHEFIDELSKAKNEDDQHYFIVMILLHEMIHQYCAENGIDDKGHNDKWQSAAYDHGLCSAYENNVLQYEFLDFEISDIFGQQQQKITSDI